MDLRPVSVIAEPITLAQAKLHLRVDNDGDSPPVHPDDSLIAALITAARQHAENFTGRSIAVANYVYRTHDFEFCIPIPRPPVIFVSLVEYQDETGAWQPLDPETYYFDDDYDEPALLMNPGVDFPATGDFANPVRVSFRAGYGDEDSPPLALLPKPIYAAMLLLIGHLYENREQVVDKQTYVLPMGVEALLRPYRILRGLA